MGRLISTGNVLEWISWVEDLRCYSAAEYRAWINI